MSFCQLANKECTITQTVHRSDTLSSTSNIKGLKDCSEKTCKFRGNDGCLLLKNSKI